MKTEPEFQHLLGSRCRATFKIGNAPVNVRDGIIIHVRKGGGKALRYDWYTLYDAISDAVYSNVPSLACSWILKE